MFNLAINHAHSVIQNKDYITAVCEQTGKQVKKLHCILECIETCLVHPYIEL